MDRKYYILGALIIALGAYLYFSQMQVSPLGVFTAEGWQKYVEVNLPEGHPEDFYFEMPVQPEMKSDFSDVVVTDGDGRILYLTRSDEVKWSVAGAPVIGSYSVAYPLYGPSLSIEDPVYVGVLVPDSVRGSVQAEFVGSSVESAELLSHVKAEGMSSVVFVPNDANAYLAAVGPSGDDYVLSSGAIVPEGSSMYAYTGDALQVVSTLGSSEHYNEYFSHRYMSCLPSGLCLVMTHYATSSPDHAYVWAVRQDGTIAFGPRDLGVGYPAAAPMPDGSGWYVYVRGNHPSYGGFAAGRVVRVSQSGSVTTVVSSVNNDSDYYSVPDFARLGDDYYAVERLGSRIRLVKFTLNGSSGSYTNVYELDFAEHLAGSRVWMGDLYSDGQRLYGYVYVDDSDHKVLSIYRYHVLTQEIGDLVLRVKYTDRPYIYEVAAPDTDGYVRAVTILVGDRGPGSDGGQRWTVVDWFDRSEVYYLKSTEYGYVPVVYGDGTVVPYMEYFGGFTSGHNLGVLAYGEDGVKRPVFEYYVDGYGGWGYQNKSAHGTQFVTAKVNGRIVYVGWAWHYGDSTWKTYSVPESAFVQHSFVQGGDVTVGSPIMSTDSTVRVFVHVPQDVNRLYVFWGSDQTVQHRSAWSDTQVDVAMSEPRDVEIVPAEINVTSISFDGNKVVASYGIYVDGSLDVNHYYDSPRYYELPLIQNSVESDVEGRQPVDGYSISEDFVQLFGIDPQPLVLVRIEAYGVFRHVDPVTYVLTAQLPDLQPATMSLSATKTQLAGAEEVNVTIDYPAQDAKCYLVDDQNRLVREVNYPTFSILADAGMTINVVCASTDYQPARASLTFTGIPSGPPVGGGGGGGAPPAPATSEPTVQVASATGSTGTPSWVFVAAVVAVIGLFLALSRRH